MFSSSSVLPSPVRITDDGAMSGSFPRAGGPSRRRSFSPAHMSEHLVAYEDANSRGEGGAYLRRHGLYSSLISEWRRLRDAGMLNWKEPGVPVGHPTSEQAEIAQLRRRAEEAERKLATTEIRLGDHGKSLSAPLARRPVPG